MKKLIFIFLLCLGTQALAAEMAGVKLEDKLQLDAHPVVLSGVGVRTKFFIKVYVAGLYLTEKTTSSEAVMADVGAKRMSFHLLRKVTGKQVLDGINETIMPNNTEEEMKVLEARLFEFEKMFVSVSEIKENEVVNLDYIPGLGTRVSINGVVKGHIEGIDFNRALLKIWVGNKPVQAALKKSLLGGE